MQIRIYLTSWPRIGSRALLLFFLVNVWVLQSFAQDAQSNKPSSYKKSYWLDVGFGWGGQGGAANIGLSYELVPRRFISMRYSGVWTSHTCEDNLIVVVTDTHPLGKNADAFEFSYGIMKKGKVALMNLSAGLSYVTVESGDGSGPASSIFSTCPDNYHSEKEGTVGLVLRGQFIPSWRWGGIGISPALNVNPKYTFGSLTINLALGRIRPKAVKGA